MANNLKLNLIAVVLVSCSQPSGYRRAGISFQHGENELHNVSESQLEALKKDPRLVVQITQATESTSSQTQLESGGVDNPVNSDGLVLDLSNAPEELAHIIAVINELQPSKKPTVDELAFEVDGVDGKQKPTAAQRDDAWAWYTTHVVEA